MGIGYNIRTEYPALDAAGHALSAALNALVMQAIKAGADAASTAGLPGFVPLDLVRYVQAPDEQGRMTIETWLAINRPEILRQAAAEYPNWRGIPGYPFDRDHWWLHHHGCWSTVTVDNETAHTMEWLSEVRLYDPMDLETRFAKLDSEGRRFGADQAGHLHRKAA